MRMNIKFTSILMVILLLVSLQCLDTVNSAGVVPAKITMSNLLKGSSYLRSIRIFGGEEPIEYGLNATGDIETWVSFYKPSNLTEPIRNITILDREEILVQFVIPEDIANGEYSGTVYAEILGVKEMENITGSMVTLRFPIQVSIDVTGVQVLTGNVTGIKTRDVEVGQPLTIQVEFLNTGNVIATPLINVNITRAGWPISSFTYSNSSVYVDSGTSIDVDWDTTNREPGSYTAIVTVMLGGNSLAEKELLFEILPRGTFTRKGEIINLSYSGELSPGSMLIIQAEFKNTGQVETAAKFMADVYRDGTLIELLESVEEPIVNIQETYLFSSYLEIEESGNYEIHGYVLCENNKTAIQILSFKVAWTLENVLTIGIAVLLVIVGIGVVYFLFKRRKLDADAKKKLGNIENGAKVKKKSDGLMVKLPWNKRLHIAWRRPEGITSSKMYVDSKFEPSMIKKDVIKEFTSLKGVSKAKAELLYSSGFYSLRELRKASVEDLIKIKGIDEKFVEEVKDQLNTKMDK